MEIVLCIARILAITAYETGNPASTSLPGLPCHEQLMKDLLSGLKDPLLGGAWIKSFIMLISI